MMTTYELCKKFLTNLFSQDTETIKLSEPISTDSSYQHKPYRISSTPYRDALMNNLINVNFKNRNFKYYQNLGDEINKIVEKRYNQRSHRYWWIDEYLRESYIKKNRLLKRNNYCVITKPKKGIKI